MEPPDERKNYQTQGQCSIAIPGRIFRGFSASNAVNSSARGSTNINYIYVLLSSVLDGCNSKLLEFGLPRQAFWETLWYNKTYGWTCNFLVSFPVQYFVCMTVMMTVSSTDSINATN